MMNTDRLANTVVKKQRVQDGSVVNKDMSIEESSAASNTSTDVSTGMKSSPVVAAPSGVLGSFPTMPLGLQKDVSWSAMLNDVEGLGGLGPMPSMNAVLEKRQSSVFSISSLLPSTIGLTTPVSQIDSSNSMASIAHPVASMSASIPQAPPQVLPTITDGSGGNQKYMDAATGEYLYPPNVKPMTFSEKQQLVQKITRLPSQYLRGLMDVISKYQRDTVRQVDDEGYAFDLGQMKENTVWAISDYVRESMMELEEYMKSMAAAAPTLVSGMGDPNVVQGVDNGMRSGQPTNPGDTTGKSPHLRHQVHEVALNNPKISAICNNENQGKFMEQVEMYSKPKVTKSRVKPSKKHECPTCGKQFRGRSELQNHIRTHTGEKPLKCSYPGCQKRYAHSSNLRAHERTHAGVKPYACHYDGCGKSFAHSVSLKEHIWMHAGFQPYVCPYEGCEKRFTQVSNFARHKKTHEKDDRNDRSKSNQKAVAAPSVSPSNSGNMPSTDAHSALI